MRACAAASLLALLPPAFAQQFAGDNQWGAPHGVATLVGTVGEDYSQFYAIAALVPEWEFNFQLTRYRDAPRDRSGAYTATNFYVKRRLSENEAGTAGYAVLAGTGLFPKHTERGQVANAFESWWATGVATFNFVDDHVLLDILPGVVANLDQEPDGDTAWGFTYTSRVAIYGIIPQSAIVAEVFGAAGEADAETAYRAGVRWESKRWIVAATYSEAFDGSAGAGFELGVMYFTDPRFCFGGCRSR